MEEHLSPIQIEGYCRRSLSSRERLALSDHIATCATCRESLLEAKVAEGLPPGVLQALGTGLFVPPEEMPTHLSDEQLTDYVNDALDEFDREIIAEHLMGCSSCTRAVEELRSFRMAMSIYPPKAYAPEPRGAWWKKLVSGRDRWSGMRPLQFVALPLAAAAVSIWVTLQYYTYPRVTRLQQTVQALQQNGEKRPPSLGGQIARLPEPSGNNKAPRSGGLLAHHVPDRNKETPNGTGAREQESPKKSQTDTKISTSGLPARQPSMVEPRDQAQLEAPRAPGKRSTLVRRPRVLSPEETPQPRKPSAETAPMLASASENETFARLYAECLKSPRLAKLHGVSDVTMGGDEQKPEFEVLAPVGSSVSTDRPTFKWKPLPSAARYQVKIFDLAKPDEDPVAETSGSGIPGPEWTPSAPLPRGRFYQLEVVGFRPKSSSTAQESELEPVPAPPERFFVLGAVEAAALEQTAKRYANAPALLALVYARAGLRAEARQKWHEAEARFQQALAGSSRKPFSDKP
jgi:hypothetical protein